METDLKKLIYVFESQCRVQKSLLDVLDKEKQAIVESDLAALNETNREKESLVRKIKKLEDSRLQILEDLETSSGKKCRELTLESLVKNTREPYASRLKKCRDEIRLLLKNVKELNEGNRVLLTHATGLITGSLRLLNNLMNSNAVYYRTGKIQTKDHSGRVLSGDV